MFVGWRRICRDLRNRRFVDAYAVAFVAFILAGLSIVTDIITDQVQWAALLVGVGNLVLGIAIPESSSSTNGRFAQRPLRIRCQLNLLCAKKIQRGMGICTIRDQPPFRSQL